MKQWLLRHLAATGVALLSALSLPAQKLTVNPSGVLQAGSTVQVSYSDPSQANTDVTVEIMGGFPIPQIERVTIHLDDAGNGSAAWNVNPFWLYVSFNAPGVNEVTAMILR